MTGVRVVAALRTPVAPRGGGLSRLDLDDLCAPVLTHVIAAAGLSPDAIDDVVLGNALGAGGNPARRVALAAGLPERVAGLTLDRQCCGGLDALIIGAALIASGQAEVIAAGGVESYSRRPVRLRTDPGGGEPVAYDRPPFAPWPDRDPEMDDAADALAIAGGVSRTAQDDWAIESHRKAGQTEMSAELVPLAGLDRDPFTRNLTPRLAGRAPRLVGSITAANAAVAADGAAVCILVSDRVAARLSDAGLSYRGGATLGACPDLPGLAPVGAIRALLSRTDTKASDLTTVEVMEAYAVQAIACVRGAALDPAIVNLGGGGLARGHPVGASGAINVVRLFHELRQRGGTGLAAIAAAGGLGTAVMLSVS